MTRCIPPKCWRQVFEFRLRALCHLSLSPCLIHDSAYCISAGGGGGYFPGESGRNVILAIQLRQKSIKHEALLQLSYASYCLRRLFFTVICLKDCDILGCIAMWTCIGSLTFRRNGSKSKPSKKQETVRFSETPSNFYRSTLFLLHSLRCENLKSKYHTICRFLSLLPLKSCTREYGNSSFLFAYSSVC
jgi:hypothetical protein